MAVAKTYSADEQSAFVFHPFTLDQVHQEAQDLARRALSSPDCLNNSIEREPPRTDRMAQVSDQLEELV